MIKINKVKRTLCLLCMFLCTFFIAVFYTGCEKSVVLVDTPLKLNQNEMEVTLQSYIDNKNDEIKLDNMDLVNQIIFELKSIKWYKQKSPSEGLNTNILVNVFNIKSSEERTTINLVGISNGYGYVTITTNNVKQDFCIKKKDFDALARLFKDGINVSKV